MAGDDKNHPKTAWQNDNPVRGGAPGQRPALHQALTADSVPGSDDGRNAGGYRQGRTYGDHGGPGLDSAGNDGAHDQAQLMRELSRLRQEHRDLDTAIEALDSMASGDRLQLQRLKKRKLVLRDRINDLEDRMTPDIIA